MNCRPQFAQSTARRKRRQLIYAWMIATMMAASPLPSSAQTAAASEHQVKAAFLFNFVKFVTWPPDTFAGDKKSMKLCVVGRDPLGDELSRMISGKSVRDHPLEFLRITDPSSARGCHLVYVGQEWGRAREFITAVRGVPALTVGEVPDFVAWGGVINLVMENEQVRFEINLDAANTAGLKVSSKLLALARNVYVGKWNP